MKRLLLALVTLLPMHVSAQEARIPGAVRVDSMGAEYFKEDYQKAVRCAGLVRPFEGIVWYIVPGGSFRDPVQEELGEQRIRYWGETILTHNPEVRDTIYLAEVRPEWIVRHEVIHYLRDKKDHDDYMNHRCEAPYDSRFEPPTAIAKQ